MSRAETVALIRRYYDAFNAGSIEGMLDCLHEDVAHDRNQGGRHVGREAFKSFLIHMSRTYRERLADMAVMASEDGTRGAAEFTVHGEYLATEEGLPPARGQTYHLPAGAFFDVEDGRITRVTTYYNLQDWLRQVGG